MQDLITNKPPKLECDDVFDIIEGMLVYLEKSDKDKHDTNQYFIGMKYLFQGFPVKVWKGTNFAEGEYKKMNKIFARHCINYYKECWDHRN